MNRKYSKPQQLYMIAQANLKAAEAVHAESETAYIKAQGVTNTDGTTPGGMYQIRDIDTFDRICAAFCELPESKAQWAAILEARETLKAAEKNLIDYALNVVPVPAKIKATLTEAVKTNYTTRQKLIETVMKLDVSTLPKGLITA